MTHRQVHQTAKQRSLEVAKNSSSKSNAIASRSARHMSTSEIVTSIAHEVNQPLAAIVANAECCLSRLDADPPDMAGAREAVERIIRNGHHASAVLNSIRAMLKAPTPAMSELDLNDVIRDTLDLMQNEFSRNDVVPQLVLCRYLGCINGNRIQLQQVIINLIKNSIESMSGSATHPKFLQVTTIRRGGAAVVAVKDCGTGFDSATAERMFEPFYTTKNDGTGVGLSICRSIVDSHGGIIWAAPGEPQGSVFRFALPLIGHGATMTN